MSLQMLNWLVKLSARQDGADRAVSVGYESRAVGINPMHWLWRMGIR